MAERLAAYILCFYWRINLTPYNGYICRTLSELQLFNSNGSAHFDIHG